MSEDMPVRMSGDVQRMSDGMSEEIAVGCCLSFSNIFANSCEEEEMSLT